MNKWIFSVMLMMIGLAAEAQTCLRGNCQNGFGTLVWPNKSRYTGEFTGGWMTGRGLFYYANGNKYIGYWQKNQKNGEGKLVFANGDIYSGKFLNDHITGFGAMTYKNGDKYVGEWKNEKPSGKGTYYYATGERYEGEMAEGKFDGKGKFFYNDGSSYEGEWKNDLRNGYGEFFDGKSKTIAGQWENDKPFKVIESDFNDIDSSFLREDIAAAPGHSNTAPAVSEKTNPTVSPQPSASPPQPPVQSQPTSSGVKPSVESELPVPSKEDQGAVKPVSTSASVKPDVQNGSAVKPTSSVTKPSAESELPVPSKEDQGSVKPSAPLSSARPNGANNSTTTHTASPPGNVADEKLPNCNNAFCKSGKGSLVYADGSRYVGEFVNGEPKGKGICYYANGDRYEGFWDNHAPNGEGVMFFKSGLIYGAIWEHGTAKKQLSSKQEFVFNPDISEDKSKEVKIWSLIVGVSRYEHMPSLKYSDDDAYKIYAFLKSPEGGALPDNQIRLLIDEDATRNNILKALNELCLRADENDVVMMYYSGHGLEGTFIPIDYDGYQNALKHDELRELFNKSHAKHKVCYADACHSGSLLAAKSPFSSELNYFYEELDKSSGGTAFMMSSKSKEYSLEDGGLRQGIFSHYLIKGLKGDADADHNKTVTIRELFDYVSKNVREYTGSAQSPVIAGDYDENMPVGFIRQ
ncbi:MAG: caspase family protein [Saprospiraceae bacterium]|nr:caspase family protein [Saprospiraceae bacterium]HMW38566.1 caspase family protein [Saprospiraceae bacterium]HMX88767.1 caspase family protein [Saprospiraceae bacterium]HMZ40467.1 caspase family protein [Saprospiraceae bacterium]HNA64336.1 caspase family protein [Saprospiraceae bacterium]